MPVLVSLEVEALYCKVKATSSGHFPMKGDQKSHKSMSCVQEESGILSSALPSASDFIWRRKWQPTPVFLSGESQGQGSLVGCRLWGRTELDTTEAT